MIKKFKRTILRNLGFKNEVLITPKGARFGNLLYFFLRAFIYKQQGKEFKILYTKHMDELLALFPMLKEFVLSDYEINFFQIKDDSNNYYQKFGDDFTLNELNNFIKIYLLPSPILSENIKNVNKYDNSITLNIRRGDFYEKGNTSLYGYDQIGFIKHVFSSYLETKKYDTIIVVSDDMQWCKSNFDFLNQYTNKVIYPIFINNPIIESFSWLTQANQLVLSNSTFSFWGAYISNYINQSTQKTYCPIFGSRRISNTDLYQFNPNWKMIKDFDFDQKF